MPSAVTRHSSPVSHRRWHTALGLLIALLWPIERGLAQFSLTLAIDEPEAITALGQGRLPKMYESIERVKNFFEGALANSNAVLTVPVRWQVPEGSSAADSGIPALRAYSWSTIRDRLINTGDEPVSETNVYDALPLTQIPFVWVASDNPASPRQATQCVLTFAQAQQLQFAPTGPFGDELRLRFRPPANFSQPGSDWQFWEGKLRSTLHYRFDAVLVHEILHLLGYQSAAESTSVPNVLCLQDVYRLADNVFPAGTGDLGFQVRELRPTVEASLATRANSDFGSGAYRMSRGSRAGGDTFQASHFRSATRLTPPNPIGVMDPSTDINPDQRVGSASRADMEVLDLLGWTLNPATVNLRIADNVHPDAVSPADGAIIRSIRPTFVWTDTMTNSQYYQINLFAEAAPSADPAIFYNINATDFEVPVGQELTPGAYSWEVVGLRQGMVGGYYDDQYRTFTVACPADFNLDGNTDPDDLSDYIACHFSMPPCAEGDHNGDGNVDPDDLSDFIAAYFNPCP